MTLDEFKMSIDLAEEEGNVDALCWEWLTQAATENGKEGEIAVVLMKLVSERLMP